ncbi:hypothetical protein AB0323_01230 [Arthrobacter sp. NPDC080031]|uniref:hypothetical protein n=1 Tax=Arthrobacter sp. NPDC080031 TaxID=3155918 RepID=UPI0034502C4B
MTGRCPASLLEPMQFIVLDVGTTALSVARTIRRDFRGTAATNSLLVAIELSNHPDVVVHAAGSAPGRGYGAVQLECPKLLQGPAPGHRSSRSPPPLDTSAPRHAEQVFGAPNGLRARDSGVSEQCGRQKCAWRDAVPSLARPCDGSDGWLDFQVVPSRQRVEIRPEQVAAGIRRPGAHL